MRKAKVFEYPKIKEQKTLFPKPKSTHPKPKLSLEQKQFNSQKKLNHMYFKYCKNFHECNVCPVNKTCPRSKLKQ